jgi:site-specific DNA recombinase
VKLGSATQLVRELAEEGVRHKRGKPIDKGFLYNRLYLGEAVRDACPVGRLPASAVETAVVGQIRQFVTMPEISVRTWRAVREQDASIGEAEVRSALMSLDALWDELFPVEQARIVQLLVSRVEVRQDGIDIGLRAEGLTSLVQDLRAAEPARRQAA